MPHGNILHVGDQHLTDRAEDEYRWKLFPVLKQLIHSQDIEAIIFYGDLTDIKDRHTGAFINRVRKNIEWLATEAKLFILKGNHDYKDESSPTFKFLDRLPDIVYADVPMVAEIAGRRVSLLPYSYDPENDEAWTARLTDREVDFVSTHITVNRVKASNGQELQGIPAEYFGDLKVYSGDIHVPQTMGNVTYVGMPYHKNFGDSFVPRFILTTEKGDKSLVTTSVFPRRHVLQVSSIEELQKVEEVKKGDQVKVRFFLTPEQLHEWDTLRHQVEQVCEEHEWDRHHTEVILKQVGVTSEEAPEIDTPDDARDVLHQFMEERYPKMHRLYFTRGVEIIDAVEGK